ncbi:MAG: aldo/keto reductase [Anaerolineales bacterium]|nr:aldo/keto reductase [Anaerolineales bacterium]
MPKTITDTVALSNGVEMPWEGFGVFQMEPGPATQNAVEKALEVGYRHVDTASLYANEKEVGAALKASRIPRTEVFITTKVWNTDLGYDATFKAFEKSLQLLDMDYIDLYLVHWPVKGKYLDTWKALEKLYREGAVKAIGISNFLVHQMQDVLEACEIKPMVNQCEYHPLFQRREIHQYCMENQIQFEAWAPLGQGRALDIPEVLEIAAKHGKSPAQVLLRWDLQNEVVTIPKSITPARIIENSQIFDFELSGEEMARINNLNEEKHTLDYPADCGY